VSAAAHRRRPSVRVVLPARRLTAGSCAVRALDGDCPPDLHLAPNLCPRRSEVRLPVSVRHRARQCAASAAFQRRAGPGSRRLAPLTRVRLEDEAIGRLHQEPPRHQSIDGCRHDVTGQSEPVGELHAACPDHAQPGAPTSGASRRYSRSSRRWRLVAVLRCYCFNGPAYRPGLGGYPRSAGGSGRFAARRSRASASVMAELPRRKLCAALSIE